ncbi:hypothetical protein [Klebsiella pneumoniae]|uniref:hypothetical protein n=1 Tax=Klebsiella pneumoniae TaxID=573 RepID=UPI001E4DD097|nr:hypothetical protein [Klebsiella pneumoniae]
MVTGATSEISQIHIWRRSYLYQYIILIIELAGASGGLEKTNAQKNNRNILPLPVITKQASQESDETDFGLIGELTIVQIDNISNVSILPLH